MLIVDAQVHIWSSGKPTNCGADLIRVPRHPRTGVPESHAAEATVSLPLRPSWVPGVGVRKAASTRAQPCTV